MNNEILESNPSRVSYNCSHCNELTKSPIQNEEEFFCCHGCLTVYQALKEKDLLHYYKLRESAGVKSGSVPLESNSEDYLYMQQDKFKAEFLSPTPEGLKIKFYLEGIHCVACVWLIEKISIIVSHIVSARVDLGQSTLTLLLTPNANLTDIANQLSKMGYRPHPIKSNEDLDNLHKKEERLKLIQIGVAGACTANIMLYSIAIYAGAGPSFASLFGWVSFFLSIPILFFSALPFYKSSLNALKNRTVNIDIPISVAIILGATSGLYNLFFGSNHFYFDSIATLVFLLLTSRFLVHKSLQKGLSSSGLKSLFEQNGVLRLNTTTNEYESIHSDHIAKEDILKLPPGKTIPNDCIVIEGTTYINNSMISGESNPLRVESDDTICAGAQNISSEIVVKVTKLFDDSVLGKIIHKVESNSGEKLYLNSLTDKLSKWFVLIVFSLASICFLYFLKTLGLNVAIDRTLSLIIISCPCALGLASPLALARAMSLANKKGIIIKSEKSFEELANIKSIFFDKTGTITKGNFTVEKIQEIEPIDSYRDLIYSLESLSNHPIANALKDWSQSENQLLLNDYIETPGFGVSAKFQGDTYYLGKSEAQFLEEENTIVEFKKNNQRVSLFFLSDEIQPGALELMSFLKHSKKDIHIISGDHESNVNSVARKLNLSNKNSLANQSPKDKVDTIANTPHSLMIGDGANDAMAMKEASVSISVRGAVGISLRASDIYFTKSPMTSLRNLIKLANTTYSTIKINLALSLGYNILGVALSLFGLISPLIAAILMPISSATVIIATLINLKGDRK